jgi:hypothetical protein
VKVNTTSVCKLSFAFLVLLAFLVPNFVPESFAPDDDSTNLAIQQAEDVMALAYEAVLEAELVGANVSGLLARLDIAAENLANAHIWRGLGDFENATRFANLCYNIGEEVRNEAYKLKIEAWGPHITRLFMRTVVSIVSVSGIVLASFWGWYAFKQRYYKRMLRMKPETG